MTTCYLSVLKTSRLLALDYKYACSIILCVGTTSQLCISKYHTLCTSMLSALTAVLCSRAAVSVYLSAGMEQCCRMASVSFTWFMSTAHCQCWGWGTSESISDTTYITSASGTSLRGGEEIVLCKISGCTLISILKHFVESLMKGFQYPTYVI